ncbi:hypothetical protein KR044_013471, partial [Drosophila immigrans]
HLLPAPYYGLLRSYIEEREFKVNERDTYSNNYTMRAGVPQGSVLGPLLYSLYTADIPSPNCHHMVASSKALIATYADDIAVIHNSSCSSEAAIGLQGYLVRLQLGVNDG